MTADGYDDEMGESFVWEAGDLDRYPASLTPITLAEIDRRRAAVDVPWPKGSEQ